MSRVQDAAAKEDQALRREARGAEEKRLQTEALLGEQQACRQRV